MSALDSGSVEPTISAPCRTHALQLRTRKPGTLSNSSGRPEVDGSREMRESENISVPYDHPGARKPWSIRFRR
jgi:hypothetical protein